MYTGGNEVFRDRPLLAVVALLMSAALFFGLSLFNRMEGKRALANVAEVETVSSPQVAPDPGSFGNRDLFPGGIRVPTLVCRIPNQVFGEEEKFLEIDSAEPIAPIMLEPDSQVTEIRPDDFIYEVYELDTFPIPLVQVKPTYPENLKIARIQSKVVVVVSIDKDGDVFDVEVEKAEYPEFAESVVSAVMMWKFVPGRKDGRRVNQRVRLPVSFKLYSRTGPSSDPEPGRAVWTDMRM
jgi:TonB family protein